MWCAHPLPPSVCVVCETVGGGWPCKTGGSRCHYSTYSSENSTASRPTSDGDAHIKGGGASRHGRLRTFITPHQLFIIHSEAPPRTAEFLHTHPVTCRVFLTQSDNFPVDIMAPAAITPPAVEVNKKAETLRVPKPTLKRANTSNMGTKRKIICFSGKRDPPCLIFSPPESDSGI